MSKMRFLVSLFLKKIGCSHVSIVERAGPANKHEGILYHIEDIHGSFSLPLTSRAKPPSLGVKPKQEVKGRDHAFYPFSSLEVKIQII